jgi:hypothetical protein
MPKFQVVLSAEAIVTSILAITADTEEEAKAKLLKFANEQGTMTKVPWELSATVLGSAKIEECIPFEAEAKSPIWLPGDPAPVVMMDDKNG